jgi:hypothetical protein
LVQRRRQRRSDIHIQRRVDLNSQLDLEPTSNLAGQIRINFHADLNAGVDAHVAKQIGAKRLIQCPDE